LGIKRMAIHIFVHSRPHKGLPEQSDGNQVVNRLFSKFKLGQIKPIYQVINRIKLSL